MKRKLSVIGAIIKVNNFATAEFEKKLGLPKGYLSKVVEGKIKIKPEIVIKLLQEIGISLENYVELNEYERQLSNDSTISNDTRWQKLLMKTFLICPLKDSEKKMNKHTK